MSTRTIEFKGKPLAIVGNPVSVGDKLPGSVLHANDFSAVDLGAMQGAVRLISVVPSLDTGVCDAQTKRFNEEAAKLGDAAKIIIDCVIVIKRANVLCDVIERTTQR